MRAFLNIVVWVCDLTYLVSLLVANKHVLNMGLVHSAAFYAVICITLQPFSYNYVCMILHMLHVPIHCMYWSLHWHCLLPAWWYMYWHSWLWCVSMWEAMWERTVRAVHLTMQVSVVSSSLHHTWSEELFHIRLAWVVMLLTWNGQSVANCS